jgi:hypothetical protein
METIAAADIIKETGYNTWFQFFSEVERYSAINDQHTYTYSYPGKSFQTIALNIDQNTIAKLAFVELETYIKEAGFISYKDFRNKESKDVSGHYSIGIKYIYVDKKNSVSVKKLAFNSRLLEKFDSLKTEVFDKLPIYFEYERAS